MFTSRTFERLAMSAIFGTLFQDDLTGSAWDDAALCNGSPFWAAQVELGVVAAADP